MSSVSSSSSSFTVSPRTSTSSQGLEYIGQHLGEVRYRIEAAIGQRPEDIKNSAPEEVRLVAVSKTKPPSNVLAAYHAGQRHFGENYVQEFVTKAQELEGKCPDIKWHFIGHLQSNKIPKLISVGESLSVVETIDSQRMAGIVNTAREKWIEADPGHRSGVAPLDVMIQVNTSGEEAKGGVTPSTVPDIVGFIKRECRFIRFCGLMTIGREYETLKKPNPDFVLLAKIRDSVCRIYKMGPKEVELSMGMSGDYEEAIRLGSSNVRIGSTIFGERDNGNG